MLIPLLLHMKCAYYLFRCYKSLQLLFITFFWFCFNSYTYRWRSQEYNREVKKLYSYDLTSLRCFNNCYLMISLPYVVPSAVTYWSHLLTLFLLLLLDDLNFLRCYFCCRHYHFCSKLTLPLLRVVITVVICHYFELLLL